MATEFQDFLRQRTAGSGIKDRIRHRVEWLDAMLALRTEIVGWVSTSDSDQLIELIEYKIMRAESRLGVYDAYALKLRLDFDEVDILPVGRYSIGPLSGEVRGALAAIAAGDNSISGRVDISGRDRKYMLFRFGERPADSWYVVDKEVRASLFDRARLLTILQDLWS